MTCVGYHLFIMSKSLARAPASLPSTTFQLLPGEELPGVLCYLPRTVSILQYHLRSQGIISDSLEHPEHYHRSLQTAAYFAVGLTLPFDC